MKKTLFFLIIFIKMSLNAQVQNFFAKSISMSKNDGKEIDWNKEVTVMVNIDERQNPGIFIVKCFGCPMEGNYTIKSRVNMTYEGKAYYDYALTNSEYRHVSVYNDAIYFYFNGVSDFLIIKGYMQ